VPLLSDGKSEHRNLRCTRLVQPGAMRLLRPCCRDAGWGLRRRSYVPLSGCKNV